MKKLWETSLAGVKANLIPGFALWLIGLAVVFSYYYLEPAKEGFEKIMELKRAYGYLYSAVSTAIFGGLIPFLYLWKAKQIPTGSILTWGLFFVIFWTIRGIEVDAFYRLQSWLFGDSINWKTVLAKVAVDQFLYSFIWSAPITAICYGWKDSGFSRSRFRKRLSRKWLSFKIASVLLSTWIVWIPATAIIYSLPLPLQIPLFNLVLCFYVLLLSMLTRNRSEEPTD